MKKILFFLKYPDLNDEAAVQRFFMEEISLGEQLMGMNDIENGVEHLANAVSVTAHKENILNVLRASLPDPIFKMLLEKIPEVTHVNKKKREQLFKSKMFLIN
jgi:mitochondrial import receptor subunit TOM20